MTNEQKSRIDWLSNHGFNIETEKTYIYFPDNSYEVKDTLREAGFRYSKELIWHAGAVPTGYEGSCIEVDLSEVAEMTAWGQGLYKPTVKQIVTEKINAARPKVISKSEWIGEDKDRLYDLPVVLKSTRDIETRYGITTLVTFMNGENKIQWWTQCEIAPEPGASLLLTATIKNHTEYKGEKITTVSRCKMKEV